MTFATPDAPLLFPGTREDNAKYPYVLYWREELQLSLERGSHYFGTADEIRFIVHNYLKNKSNLLEVEVYESGKYDPQPETVGHDGHWHKINGEWSTHTWEECPENKKSRNWNLHEPDYYGAASVNRRIVDIRPGRTFLTGKEFDEISKPMQV